MTDASTSTDAIAISTAAALVGISPDRIRQLIRAGHAISLARGMVGLTSLLRGYSATLRASASAPGSAALGRGQRIKAEIITAETEQRRADLAPREEAADLIKAVAEIAVDQVRVLAHKKATAGLPPEIASAIRAEAADVAQKITAARDVALTALRSGRLEEIDR